MLDVIRMHRDSLRPIKPENVQPSLLRRRADSWDMALALGEKFGYKNSQVTVLAPTGTIGFMMDCDTTGVEPDLALVKYKKLVGGGVIKIVNNTVPAGADEAGLSAGRNFADRFLHRPQRQDRRRSRIQARAPARSSIARCAAGGGRSIAWRGHLKMMAAAQPFLSGAISKTINMPEESTVEDIMQAYIESWKLGVKAVAIYRDNSKGSQPLSAAGDKKEPRSRRSRCSRARRSRRASPASPSSANSSFAPIAANCPASAPPSPTNSPSAATKATSPSACTKTGEPGEIFIKMAKEGSTLSGFMDGFALSVSIGLQYGVPLKALVDKFINTRFEPAGLHRPSGHPVRQVRARLHRPLARRALHLARLPDAQRRSRAARGNCDAATPRHRRCPAADAIRQTTIAARRQPARSAPCLTARPPAPNAAC